MRRVSQQAEQTVKTAATRNLLKWEGYINTILQSNVTTAVNDLHHPLSTAHKWAAGVKSLAEQVTLSLYPITDNLNSVTKKVRVHAEREIKRNIVPNRPQSKPQ